MVDLRTELREVWSRRRLSSELSAQGITTINTVTPSFFPDTGFFGGGVPEQWRRVIVEQRRPWPGWDGRRTLVSITKRSGEPIAPRLVT